MFQLLDEGVIAIEGVRWFEGVRAQLHQQRPKPVTFMFIDFRFIFTSLLPNLEPLILESSWNPLS